MAVLKIAGIASQTPNLPSKEIVDSVGRNSGILKFLHRADSDQGNSVLVDAITTTNSSAAVFDEDDAIAAAAPTISQGTFAMEEFKVCYGITGSALRRAGANASDLILSVNADDAYRSLVSVMEAWIVSSKHVDKLVGQVDDDTTNWGGLNRGSVTALKSKVVDGGSTTLAGAKLTECQVGMQDVPYMGAPEVILSSPKQLQAYLTSVVAAPTHIGGGGIADAGYNGSVAAFGGIPWFPVRGMLNSVVVFLTGVRGGAGVPAHFWVNFQPTDYLEKYGAASVTTDLVVGFDSYSVGRIAWTTLGQTDDSVSRYGITAGAYVCRMPAAQGLVENLT